MAARVREEQGYRVRIPGLIERIDEAAKRSADVLGAEAAAAAFAEGRRFAPEQAVAYLRRSRGERDRPALGWDSLTPMERQVVERVADGRSNPEVAVELVMSRDTVKTHLSHAYRKLGVIVTRRAGRRVPPPNGA